MTTPSISRPSFARYRIVSWAPFGRSSVCGLEFTILAGGAAAGGGVLPPLPFDGAAAAGAIDPDQMSVGAIAVEPAKAKRAPSSDHVDDEKAARPGGTAISQVPARGSTSQMVERVPFTL